MTWELVVAPEAEVEIAEARDWYDERAPGLGADFVAVVRNTITAIVDNPFQYQPLWKNYRRAVLHRFPYLVVYAVSDHLVRVVTYVHGQRDPRDWHERL